MAVIGIQVYVNNSLEAVEVYKKAFNAEITPTPAFNNDGTYMHCELRINDDPFLYISEAPKPTEIMKQYHKLPNQTMQFCVNLETEQAIQKAYDVLSIEGVAPKPPAPTDWCPMLCNLIDKFGISWGLNI